MTCRGFSGASTILGGTRVGGLHSSCVRTLNPAHPRELSHVGESRPLHYKLWELVRYILPAGCYAFGGPTAHLAVFHDLFVTKLHWLNDQVCLLYVWEQRRRRRITLVCMYFTLLPSFSSHFPFAAPIGVCGPPGPGNDAAWSYQLRVLHRW